MAEQKFVDIRTTEKHVVAWEDGDDIFSRVFQLGLGYNDGNVAHAQAMAFFTEKLQEYVEGNITSLHLIRWESSDGDEVFKVDWHVRLEDVLPGPDRTFKRDITMAWKAED